MKHRLEDLARVGVARLLSLQRSDGGFGWWTGGELYDPSDGVGNPRAAGLPPWPDLLAIHRAYNEVIAETAERHDNVHLVDIHRPFLGHGVHCVQWWREHYRPDDPHYWYFTNLEDPNNRGYDALRRLFLNEIVHVLAPRPSASGPIPVPTAGVEVE